MGKLALLDIMTLSDYIIKNIMLLQDETYKWNRAGNRVQNEICIYIET